MKKHVLFICLICCVFPLMAQITHTASGNVDKTAEEILKKASKKIEASSGVTFNVTMSNLDANKKTTGKLTASVLYQQGKYCVTFNNNVLYCDGKSTWHWNKDANEVVVNNLSSASDDLMNPGALLANYNKNFKSKFIRQEDNGDFVIDLTPKKNMSYYKIRIIINDKYTVKRMEMHNYDSSCAKYDISKFSAAKNSSGTFSFPQKDYPNVEIIDMR